MMKVKLRKASDWNFEEVREVETLNDLKALEEEFSSELIVNFLDNEEKAEEGVDIDITIYDDYVE